MVMKVAKTGSMRKRFTATDTSIASGQQPGSLLGILCSTTTAGTFQVSDSNGAITGVITPVAGSFTEIPVEFVGTLTITVTGVIDATAFWMP